MTTMTELLLKPFQIGGVKVTETDLRRVYQAMLDEPRGFTGMDCLGALHESDLGSVWTKQEAMNRLMQRLRKAGAAHFYVGRWQLLDEGKRAIAKALATEPSQ